MTITGDRIKNTLEQLDMKQKDLADAVQVSEVSISRYISGERIPRSNILSKIAKVLHVSMEYLSGETSDIERINNERLREGKGIKSQVYIEIAEEAEKKKIPPEKLRKLLKFLEEDE
jgi:transcriptional regulator with XRE-family HTH domain